MPNKGRPKRPTIGGKFDPCETPLGKLFESGGASTQALPVAAKKRRRQKAKEAGARS